MNTPPLSDRILAFVYAPEFRPSKPRMILRHLKLTEDDYPELRREIKKLVREGRLAFGANHIVTKPTSIAKAPAKAKPPKPQRPRLEATPHTDLDASAIDTLPSGNSTSDLNADEPEIPADSKRRRGPADELIDESSRPPKVSRKAKINEKEVVGVFRLAPAGGYGFVEIPRGTGAMLPDVFIPASVIKNAMDGDSVRVELQSPDRQGRLEGRIVEVVSRKRRQFSGTFQTENDKSWVWLDGAKLEHPISIGDVRGLPLENNDKVIVELVHFPDEFQPGEGVILKVLGSSKNPAVDTQAVIHQFGLPEEFQEHVLEDARLHADRFDESVIPEGRRDLTAIPTLTIDPVDARDFDDAISLCQNEKGNWELQVHIADVAFFVPQGSPLDEEARERGNSVYLPDRVIPMLPETISNHLASLQPDRRRLAKTVFIEYTPDGVLIHHEVFNSVIRNAHRFNYEQIDQFLEDREPWRERLPAEIFRLVENMHALAMMLRALRKRNGAVELSLPEVKIDLDRLGKVKGAHVVAYTESHQIIEEFMLAANQAVASWLDALKLPYLRRAHAPPDRLKIRRLTDFVRALGIPADDMQDRFEIQRVVDSVRGKPTEYAINYAILKSMSKAVYQSEFERHYALNMSHYCHFTSPIRRYPDLVVHRIVQKLLEGQNAKESVEVLERLGQHCSHTEQTAESAERELVRVKLLHFLDKKIGELLTGIVSGVRANGLTVRGIEIPVDGLIPVERLPKDRYRFDRDTHTLEGFRNGSRFRLGDELIVRIERVDLARRQLEFRLEKVTHQVEPATLAPRKGGKPKDGSFKSKDSRRKPSGSSNFQGAKKRRRPQ
jgi:ribonuclease R